MEAEVIGRDMNGYVIVLRLWTGEKLRLKRPDVPVRGPLRIGDKWMWR